MAGSWPFTLRAPRCSDTFAFYYFCCILVPVVFAILGCISSPRVRKFDMVTIYPNFTSPSGLTRETLGIRFGLWSFCVFGNTSEWNPCDYVSPCPGNQEYACSTPSFTYSVQLRNGTDTVTHEINTLRTAVFQLLAGCVLVPAFLLWIVNIRKFWISLLAISVTIAATTNAIVLAIQAGSPLDKIFNENSTTDSGLALFQIVSTVLVIQDVPLRIFQVWTYMRRVRQRLVYWRRDHWERCRYIQIPLEGQPTQNYPSQEKRIIGDVDSQLSGFECSICWEVKGKLCALPCYHIFCTNCVNKCLPKTSAETKCPDCSTPCTRGDCVDVFCILEEAHVISD